MQKSKYVVLRERVLKHNGRPAENSSGKFFDSENIYVFQPNIIHSDFVDRNHGNRRCVGAGFVVRGQDGEHWCNGESESLGIKSRPEDTILLKILLGEPLSK